MLKWLRRDAPSVPTATLGSIEIHRAWARPSSETPQQAGGFFVLTNKGAEPDRLVAASSPAAEKVEIHAIKVVGPDIKMCRRDDGLAVPAGVTLTLQPRGYHLLVIGLGAPLVPGARLPVTLTFEKAGSVDLDLPAEAPGLVGDTILVEERQPG